MSAHSVKLRFERDVKETEGKGNRREEGMIYISPQKARQLLKMRKAIIFSHLPFELKLKREAQAELEKCIVQNWGSVSLGLVMNGAMLRQNLPIR